MKKKKGLNNPSSNKEDMKGKLGYIQPIILLILILIFGYLLLYPSVSYQVLTVNIYGTTQSKVNSIDIVYLNKPTIDIFSKSNPKGPFTLKLELIINKDGQSINSTLYNVGIGESNFPITGGNIQKPVIMKYKLYFNDNLLDSNEQIIADK